MIIKVATHVCGVVLGVITLMPNMMIGDSNNAGGQLGLGASLMMLYGGISGLPKYLFMAYCPKETKKMS
jgi:hypothetical protein